MYDIVIIGAGPGGATLARTLPKDLKVALVDQRDMTTKDHHKPICCGGLLAPDAQEVLARHGLGLPKEILTGPQMFSVKTLDFDNNLVKHYQRHYINVDREAFDRWLCTKIPRSITTYYQHQYITYKAHKNHFEIHLRKGNEVTKLKTKHLIGADGPLSRVRSQAYPDHPKPRPYVAIQYEFHTEGLSPYYGSIFDKSITDFYGWVIQKEQKILVGAALPKEAKAKVKFHKLLEKLEDTYGPLDAPIKKTGTIIQRPKKIREICLGKQGIYLLGEAAGLISPSSAEGISYALKSGYALGKAFAENPQNPKAAYQRKLLSLKVNIWIKTLKLKVMYSPWLRKLVMKSGLLSMTVED